MMNSNGLRTLATIVLALVAWLAPTADVKTASAGEAAEKALVTLSSGDLSVAYDTATGTFSARRDGKGFLARATFGDFFPPGPRKVTTGKAADGFLPGQLIRVDHASGRSARLVVYDGLPFVCVETTIENRAAEPVTLKAINPLAADLALGPAPKDLRTLGYDGLAPADVPKTTYMAMTVADPASGAGVVCAWLTHDRGSGIVSLAPAEGAVRVEARSDYGRVQIPAGGSVEGEKLLVGLFDDARLGLEAYADAMAKLYHVKVKPVPSGYMTWYHARALDEKRMPVLAAWCAKNLKPYGFDFLQIDDGWQVSRRDFTAHDPKGPYPGGMKPTAEAIRKQGFMAGIWVTPFGWDHKRPAFAGHRDWFVRREDGSVYAVKWGGDSLDMTNPEARKFLHGAIDRIANRWGYNFFKLDALWAGVATKLLYPNPAYRPDGIGDAVFHDPTMSNVHAFREGLKTVRDAAGPDVYLLGCTASQNMRTLGGSVGLVDGMRVGVDSGRKWPGILANAKVATAVYYLHGRVWHNDPDVLYLDKSFSLEQVRLWASWLAISGQVYMVSDWLPDVPADRLDVIRRTIPNHNLRSRPVDLFETHPARIWHLTKGEGESRRDLVALFNWSERPEKIGVDLKRLGLPPGDYARFEYWTGEFLQRHPGPLEATVPPRACRVFSLRKVDHPVVISTSRHVTQGIVDLVDVKETFDKGSSAIEGTSRVVGGDPYEIRVAVPNVTEPWVVDEVELSEADRRAGVTVKLAGPRRTSCARLVISSPTSREVSWRVRFFRDHTEPPPQRS